MQSQITMNNKKPERQMSPWRKKPKPNPNQTKLKKNPNKRKANHTKQNLIKVCTCVSIPVKIWLD